MHTWTGFVLTCLTVVMLVWMVSGVKVEYISNPPKVDNQPKVDNFSSESREELTKRAENAQREIKNAQREMVAEALFVRMAAEGKVPMGQQPADYWRNLAREAYDRTEAFMAESKSRQSKNPK